MKLLLDTHAFLWFVRNDPKLSEAALDAIAAPENDLFLSPASYAPPTDARAFRNYLDNFRTNHRITQSRAVSTIDPIIDAFQSIIVLILVC